MVMYMRLNEAKIGMRVGLCRAACLQSGWDKYTYDYYLAKVFPGKIIKLDIAMNAIKIGNSDADGWFSPSYLIQDE